MSMHFGTCSRRVGCFDHFFGTCSRDLDHFDGASSESEYRQRLNGPNVKITIERIAGSSRLVALVLSLVWYL